MAGSVNKVILIGHCGADPEVRATQGGKSIANLRVATSESWRDKSSGEKRESTQWHKIAIFNEHIVRFVEQYVKKGAKLYIEGQLQTRKWTDKDGNDRYSTEVVLQGFNATLTMLDGGGKSSQGSDPGYDDYAQDRAQKARQKDKEDPIVGSKGFDDRIPF